MTGKDCAAPSSSCGTPGGWRKGGRCLRCRHAKNEAEANRRHPPLDAAERPKVLAALRAGDSPENAATAAERTGRSLFHYARRDGEIAAALAGKPVHMQYRARIADYVAALIRHAGDEQATEAELLITAEEAQALGDVLFAARPLLGECIKKENDFRFRELWADEDLTTDQIAELLGVTRATVTVWRRRLGLPVRKQGVRHWREGGLGSQQEEILRQMWRDGAPAEQIAQRLGVSTGAVYMWRRRLHLPPRSPAYASAFRKAAAPRPAKEKTAAPRLAKEKKLRELWTQEQLTMEEIAARLGVSSNSVRRWARLLNLPTRPKGAKGKPLAPQKEQLLRELWADHRLSMAKVSERLNMTPKIVHRHAKDLGLPPRPRARVRYPQDRLTPQTAREFTGLWRDPTITQQTVAEHFGVHVQTINRWRQRLNLPKRYSNPSERMAAARAHLAQKRESE